MATKTVKSKRAKSKQAVPKKRKKAAKKLSSSSIAKKSPKKAARKTPTNDQRKRCSFCDTPASEVDHLIEGKRAFICNNCANSVNDVIAKQQIIESFNPEGKKSQTEKFHDKKADIYVSQFVKRHFEPENPNSLVTAIREFPLRMRADIQIAINKILKDFFSDDQFTGISAKYSQEGLSFADLLEEGQYSPRIAPLQYKDLDIGEEQPVPCLVNGLWACEEDGTKFAILLSFKRNYYGGGNIHIEIAVPAGNAGQRIANHYFKALEDAIYKAASYRGKVLSLEEEYQFSGQVSEVLVHKLATVTQEQIILPDTTIKMLQRNVIQFVNQKKDLSRLKMPIKKGILFYGPPGTGKTYCIKYLASQLPDYTTLLITADQMRLLQEYMILARLLQPSMVVIEDVDLIAKHRESIQNVGVESLLNRLLNEMDGLKEDSDILFILTSNRPEALETALAERPGRIDQAIEFPLPDKRNRTQLIHLYANDIKIKDELVELIATKTENVSAAFIKELMRRIAQNIIMDKKHEEATNTHVNDALDEMLFNAGRLNLRIMGGDSSS